MPNVVILLLENGFFVQQVWIFGVVDDNGKSLVLLAQEVSRSVDKAWQRTFVLIDGVSPFEDLLSLPIDFGELCKLRPRSRLTIKISIS